MPRADQVLQLKTCIASQVTIATWRAKPLPRYLQVTFFSRTKQTIGKNHIGILQLDRSPDS